MSTRHYFIFISIVLVFIGLLTLALCAGGGTPVAAYDGPLAAYNDRLAAGRLTAQDLMATSLAAVEDAAGPTDRVLIHRTDITFRCTATDCVLLTLTLDVFTESNCIYRHLGLMNDRPARQAVTYDYQLTQGWLTVVPGQAGATWYAGDLSRLPLAPEEAARTIRGRLDADYLGQHPAFIILMELRSGSWRFFVTSDLARPSAEQADFAFYLTPQDKIAPTQQP